jgi:trans-aconitate methyltransferase
MIINTENYEKMLTIAANWIPQDEERVLEIMCHNGEFAKLLKERHIKNYVGFDDNEQKIIRSRIEIPKYKFMCSDIRDNYHYFRKMTLVVAFDYLQRIRDDLELINNIKPETKLIFAVPNYEYQGFYRWHEIEDWQERYSHLINVAKIITFQNPKKEFKRTFLIKATRSDYIDEKTWKNYEHVSFDMMMTAKTVRK